MKKISDIILKIFSVGITLCLFAGGISLVGFVVALIIGGETATAICVFIHKTYFPWVITLTTVFSGLGLLGMYINKVKSLTFVSKESESK